MKTIGTALSCLLLSCAVASAETDPPDMRGLWKVELSVVGHAPDGDRQGADRYFTDEFEMEVRIDWQDGRRFGGAEVVNGSAENMEVELDEFYSGVVSVDGAQVYMVDDNGFDTCTLISPERMECVYRHVEPRHSVVSSNVWTKID